MKTKNEILTFRAGDLRAASAGVAATEGVVGLYRRRAVSP